MKIVECGETLIGHFEFKTFPVLKDFWMRQLGTLTTVTLKSDYKINRIMKHINM